MTKRAGDHGSGFPLCPRTSGRVRSRGERFPSRHKPATHLTPNLIIKGWDDAWAAIGLAGLTMLRSVTLGFIYLVLTDPAERLAIGVKKHRLAGPVTMILLATLVSTAYFAPSDTLGRAAQLAPSAWIGDSPSYLVDKENDRPWALGFGVFVAGMLHVLAARIIGVRFNRAREAESWAAYTFTATAMVGLILLAVVRWVSDTNTPRGGFEVDSILGMLWLATVVVSLGTPIASGIYFYIIKWALPRTHRITKSILGALLFVVLLPFSATYASYISSEVLNTQPRVNAWAIGKERDAIATAFATSGVQCELIKKNAVLNCRVLLFNTSSKSYLLAGHPDGILRYRRDDGHDLVNADSPEKPSLPLEFEVFSFDENAKLPLLVKPSESIAVTAAIPLDRRTCGLISVYGDSMALTLHLRLRASAPPRKTFVGTLGAPEVLLALPGPIMLSDDWQGGYANNHDYYKKLHGRIGAKCKAITFGRNH